MGESDSPTIFCGLTGLRGGKKGFVTERKDLNECAEGSEKVAGGQALGASGRRSSGRFYAHQRGWGTAAGLVGRGNGAFFEVVQNSASRNGAEIGDGGLWALFILGVIISCDFPQIQGSQQIISEGFSDRKKKSVGLPESVGDKNLVFTNHDAAEHNTVLPLRGKCWACGGLKRRRAPGRPGAAKALGSSCGARGLRCCRKLPAPWTQVATGCRLALGAGLAKSRRGALGKCLSLWRSPPCPSLPQLRSSLCFAKMARQRSRSVW